MFATKAKNPDVAADRPARALAQLCEMPAVTLVLAALAVGLQLKSLCYSADLGEDEASHYISGLAIHDYLISALGSSPLAFIKSFHSHYPGIGIGHWGPFYYFVEALWMLVFSTSLSSVLALSVTITTATALGIYAYARQTAGRWPALFAACAFVLAPLVEDGTSGLMLDIPIALLCLSATYAYARYLEDGLIRHSVAFALAASAGMLIKGNAACLALLPPLAVLFARRIDLLRKLSFWLPAPIVAVIVGPWYALTYGMVAVGFRFQWGWHYIATAVTANSAFLLDSVGPVVLAAAFLAVGATIARAWRRRAVPLQSAVCAALFADWLFQSVAPADIQSRYLTPLLPPLLILAADGVMMTADWLRRHFPWRMPAAEAGLSLVLALTIVPPAIALPVKSSLGFMAAAPQVWHKLPPNNRAVLVVSNGLGEAGAIAALAMYDPHRPSLFAIRGSRLLGGGGYNDQDYVPRFKTVRQVAAAIDDYAIPLVLFRPNVPGRLSWLHVNQVAEAARLDPARWQELFRVTNIDPAVVLFEIRGNENKPLEAKRLTALSAPRALGAAK
jgi:hypothetical protein